MHWNNKGSSGCGENKSSVYCNGKNIKRFTAVDITGATSFGLGSLGIDGVDNLKGQIGRFLVCGNRAHPMGEEEIKIVHKYLMKEWHINEKEGKPGPKGPIGPMGPTGPP